MVYWSISPFFPVERHCQHSVWNPHRTAPFRDVALVPSWGRRNKAEETESWRQYSWKLGTECLGSSVLQQVWSILKNDSSLPKMCSTIFFHFFQHDLTYLDIYKYSLRCSCFFIYSVFQGNAILMKRCLPCFHIAHTQKWFLIIKATLLPWQNICHPIPSCWTRASHISKRSSYPLFLPFIYLTLIPHWLNLTAHLVILLFPCYLLQPSS